MENSLGSRVKIENSFSMTLNPVCEIIPKKDKAGQIFEYDFQNEIIGNPSLKPNKYSHGPFCWFTIPNGYSGKSGVYFIFDNTALQYIGECVNLENRFNTGYGIIYLRNCLHYGQQTNCRINNLILEGIKKQNRFFLYFVETPELERKDLEMRLISEYHPPWNKTHTNGIRQNPLSQKPTAQEYIHKSTMGGKYQSLFRALKKCEKNALFLSFSEIESLLGFDLPDSAYKHRAWWANDHHSHTHALAWLNAGWEVDRVNLGESVVFRKTGFK